MHEIKQQQQLKSLFYRIRMQNFPYRHFKEFLKRNDCDFYSLSENIIHALKHIYTHIYMCLCVNIFIQVLK